MKQISPPKSFCDDAQELRDIIDGVKFTCDRCRAGFQFGQNEKIGTGAIVVREDGRRRKVIRKDGIVYNLVLITPECPNCGDKTILRFNTKADGGPKLVWTSSQGKMS